jgi:peptidoglycan/LPS O-acetylase OafA/YrhL
MIGWLKLPAQHNRIFGLDLLRAFAIITVLLAHGATWVSPKFTFFYKYVVRFDGVSIFFVLSGFLIGGILIRTLEKKTATKATLWNFWVKRWARTIPPYLLALSIIMVIDAYKGISPLQYIPYVFFVQNLNWPHPSLYAEGWSLAVEEWFYLISAPCVFIAAALIRNVKQAVLLAALLVIIIVTAYRYYHFLLFHFDSRLEWEIWFRKIVFMRLDNLMYGVLSAYAAYFYKEAWLRYKYIKFVVGLIWLYMQPMPEFSGEFGLYGSVFYFTTSALATVLMLPLLSDWKSSNGFIPRLITHISLISYSMYLLHSSIINNALLYPLVRAMPFSSPIRSVIGLALFWSLTLVFSTIMYKYFEMPVMALRDKILADKPVRAVGV